MAGVLGLLLALSAGAASAQRITWYVGGDAVQLTTKIDDRTGVPPIVTGSAKATTLRAKGGAHFLSWLDGELQLVLPMEETYSTAGQTNKAKTTVLAVFAKPGADFGPARVYALGGFSSASIELSGVISGTKTTTDLAYGLGAQYSFNRNFAAQLEWVQYNKKNLDISGFSGGLDVRISAIGAGVTYTF